MLVLAALPVQAASTRYRVAQYVPLFENSGIQCSLRSFLSPETFKGVYRRSQVVRTTIGVLRGLISAAATVRRFTSVDVIWVERQAAPLGPPVLEWLARRLGRPMILDLDDVLHVRVGSLVFGDWVGYLKCHWKTDQLIRWADHVVCGNPLLVGHARRIRKDDRISLITTAVDTSALLPRAVREKDGPLTIGWIGSHSSSRFVEPVLPVLARLGERHRFRLKIVGAGRCMTVPGIEVDNITWDLAREVEQLQSLDVGLYPLPDTEIAAGKSGLKAIQYMAAGVPFVASPVGILKDLVRHGEVGYLARSCDDWYQYLDALLSDCKLRQRMGAEGRKTAVERFDIRYYAPRLVDVIRQVAGTVM